MAKANKIGILSNPLGGRAKNDITIIQELSRSIPGGIYREASNNAQFKTVLVEFSQSKIDVLVIVGGDGTIHAVLSYIFSSQVFSCIPLMAIVPAGTTNMTAKDFKISGKPAKILKKLASVLTGSTPYPCISRPVMCIKNGNAAAHYGMFFGTGIIAEGVEYFQKNVRGIGITGEKASGIVLLRYFIALMMGQHGDEQKLFKIHIENNNEPGNDENCLLVFASSLNRLLLASRPYWGREEQPIHVTLVRHKPKRLWLSILPLLFGRGGKLSEENGYVSRNLFTLSLNMNGKFIIDGEIYTADMNNGAVRISASDTISVIDLSLEK